MQIPHILISCALVDDAEAAPLAAQALQGLDLARLQGLLRGSQRRKQYLSDASAVSAHEHVIAAAQGLDANMPAWAALRARELGLPDANYAFVTPVHWQQPQVGQTQVGLVAPKALNLGDEESRILFTAMQPFFAEDGLTLHYDTALQWLVSGAPLQGLTPAASIERVLLTPDRDVTHWLPTASTPSSASATLLRRLQNEMQMLLYTHRVNDARDERGLLPINSVWFSGNGALASRPSPKEELTLIDTLREPALQRDWRGWAQALQGLDAQLKAGDEFHLTLCGVTTIHRYTPATSRPGLWTRLFQPRQTLADLLIDA